MPVFHTKTIESILEPVAQQVSKLVILHEEAEDGNAMPDLARPVQTVKLAVDNLIKVGYDTINNSEDQILKQDMPPALNRVEEASILLLEASLMLRTDPYSAPARKKLIEGSRGILQGTSALLVAFDESEVRKIIRICKNVMEYLAITEVVESMDDLVTFVKNLSPVLTKMAKEVDAREKELTHQVHREWLQRSLEQVKQLTPVLISGIKIYITTKDQGVYNQPDAQNNRDYVIGQLQNEIHEIIRVLQLTTYDEEEWDADDITVMKKAMNALGGKLKHATDWLADSQALPGSSGERALKSILEDAMRIADRCTNPDDRESIIKAVGDMQSMMDALAELRAKGQGNSPQAMSLAKGIQQKVLELQGKCARAVANTERSGVRRPAHTVAGKLEQAQRWLANPGVDDKGLGEEATRMIISEGRKVAEGLQGAKKAELTRLCDEAEILTNQLADLCRKGMANSPQARAVAANLSQKLHQLKNKLKESLVNQVADDFIDITTPLKQMSDAAQAPIGTPNREGNFEDRAGNFQAHANKLAETAKHVASAGGCTNKKTIEGIHATAQQLNDLTPQLVKAARIVLSNPNSVASMEHFDLLKKQWIDNIEKLRGLVDDAVDTAAFIKATEEGMLRDTERTEQAIKANDAPGVVNNTSSIARRANRVLQVAQQETDNSEDPQFVDRVNNSIRQLRATVTPMVQNAKGVAQNPRDMAAGGRWRGANQQLIDAVGGVRNAVTVDQQEDYPPPPDFPPPPDMSQLHISASPAKHKVAAPITPPDLQEILDMLEGVDTVNQSRPGNVFAAPPPPPPLVPRTPPAPLYPSKTSLRQADQNGFHNYGAPPPRPPAPGLFHSSPPAPPIPPPPPLDVYDGDYYGADSAPPRPPLPRDSAPPRPPPPETDDEEDFPTPQPNQPIMMAAHALHMDMKQWSSRDNEIIAAAKRMALLLARLSQLVRGEGGSKKDLIDCAKAIAESSEVVTRLAKDLARECTDKRMRLGLLQVCERIPTIGTQLKILSTVKATMLGAQGSEEDQEATEMLVGNAQNLMQSVRETVRAAEAASIKIRVDSGYSMRWVRKRPWYT